MKYFLDSAKIDEIKFAYNTFGIDGVTTNPKHIMNSGKPFLVRTPLIPGITNTATTLTALQKIIDTAKWEQLPYNTLAGAKYQSLNIQYSLTRPQQV